MVHADTQYMNELEDELQIVLAGISPERRLRGLPPEDRLRGLPPEARLRGLSTVREITVRCPLAPLGRGQGEGVRKCVGYFSNGAYWAEDFGNLTPTQMAHTLIRLSRNVDIRRYRKSKSRPGKRSSNRSSGKDRPHVSTARLLAQRAAKLAEA